MRHYYFTEPYISICGTAKGVGYFLHHNLETDEIETTNYIRGDVNCIVCTFLIFQYKIKVVQDIPKNSRFVSYAFFKERIENA